MDLRKEKRVHGTTDIKIRDGEDIYPAVLIDMSKKGLSIKSTHVFPCYKMIEVLIHIDNNPVHIKGSVRWVNEHIDKPGDSLNEIGILLINPPKEYLDYVKNL